MLCQVCGMNTCDRSDERHLFLMRDTQGQPIREGETTHMPPYTKPARAKPCGTARISAMARWPRWWSTPLCGASPASFTTRRVSSRYRP